MRHRGNAEPDVAGPSMRISSSGPRQTLNNRNRSKRIRQLDLRPEQVARMSASDMRDQKNKTPDIASLIRATSAAAIRGVFSPAGLQPRLFGAIEKGDDYGSSAVLKPPRDHLG